MNSSERLIFICVTVNISTSHKTDEENDDEEEEEEVIKGNHLNRDKQRLESKTLSEENRKNQKS